MDRSELIANWYYKIKPPEKNPQAFDGTVCITCWNHGRHVVKGDVKWNSFLESYIFYFISEEVSGPEVTISKSELILEMDYYNILINRIKVEIGPNTQVRRIICSTSYKRIQKIARL